ncbi:MAG TPA: FlgD immunoglobulin-like domain containing protein, partial [Candidatus Cloacimonadota bacterium]|nr:FlgD immunoglobulin-like domain containing protein [Candidatus Cloacimonadota bacterium]
QVSVSVTNNIVDFSLEPLDDGTFENATLGGCWILSGDADWYVDNSTSASGSFSIRSGEINDDESSTISLPFYCGVNDVISFSYKVSSEANYDYLKFYIDNELQDAWSGNAGWLNAEYNASAGNHVFRWQYAKDGGVSSGSDCAWLDDIVLPAGNYLYPPTALSYAIPSPQTGELWLINLGWEEPLNPVFLGYNLYKNGELLNTSLISEAEYTDQEFYGTAVQYFVTAVYQNGESASSNLVEINEGDWPLGTDGQIVSYTTEFIGNFPNPFNPETTLKFSLANAAKVEFCIYNIKGQLVSRLLNDKLSAGVHSIIWNGRDAGGKAVSSGIYFARMNVHNNELDYNNVKKIILLK